MFNLKKLFSNKIKLDHQCQNKFYYIDQFDYSKYDVSIKHGDYSDFDMNICNDYICKNKHFCCYVSFVYNDFEFIIGDCTFLSVDEKSTMKVYYTYDSIFLNRYKCIYLQNSLISCPEISQYIDDNSESIIQFDTQSDVIRCISSIFIEKNNKLKSYCEQLITYKYKTKEITYKYSLPDSSIFFYSLEELKDYLDKNE